MIIGVMACAVHGQEQRPRQSLPKGPIRAPATGGVKSNLEAPHAPRLLVKFIDEAQVRSTASGGLESLVRHDLGPMSAAARVLGVEFAPGIRLPDQRLKALEFRAATRSGIQQPDLAGLLEGRLVHGVAGDMDLIAEALQAFSVVEWVWLSDAAVVPMGDIPPFTPDISFLQTYKGPAPGMGFESAWELGLTGEGIRLADVEFGWITKHEDLVDVQVQAEPGQTVHPSVASAGHDHHGTAVLGILSSAVNGYGCSGMVPLTDLYTYPVLTIQDWQRSLEALTAAATDMQAGDVILIEIAWTSGAPLETDKPHWLVVRVATDAGIVVVAGAGNDSLNLDAPSWSDYASWGDSGAILVGAGSKSLAHDKLGFSNYGSRVNVHGWGEGVFTLGYGGFGLYGEDKKQSYTAVFNGTSSAAALVSAAVVALQHQAKRLYLSPLTAVEMRSLLVETGVPQGSGGHIGPFVEVSSALGALATPWADVGGALQGSGGIPVLMGQGTLEPLAPVVFTLTGVRPGSPCWLILGATAQEVPFKGGVLVPSLDVVAGPFFTDAQGNLTLSDTMPPDVVSGQEIYGQFWIMESSSSLAASNALHGVVP
jgi:hypothetical protein